MLAAGIDLMEGLHELFETRVEGLKVVNEGPEGLICGQQHYASRHVSPRRRSKERATCVGAAIEQFALVGAWQ